MRYSKRIDNLFTELGIKTMHDTARLKSIELTNLCKKHEVDKNIVLKIADGNIKIKKQKYDRT